jgi:hypothetical protein
MLSSSRVVPRIVFESGRQLLQPDRFLSPAVGARGNFKYSWSDFDPLDLFEGELLPSAIIELGRARRFAIGRSGQVRRPSLTSKALPVR